MADFYFLPLTGFQVLLCAVCNTDQPLNLSCNETLSISPRVVLPFWADPLPWYQRDCYRLAPVETL